MAGHARRSGEAAPLRIVRQRAGRTGSQHRLRLRAPPAPTGASGRETEPTHCRVPTGGGDAMTALATERLTWTAVCRYDDLLPERGVCALVGGQQVAVFRSYAGELYALSNYDPFGQAFVLSRGIVGTRVDAPTVASPLYKQVFDLRTGQCLDDPAVAVPVVDVRC